MDRFKVWLHEKPWHAYLMVALTLGLFVLAYKSYKRGSSSTTSGSPFVSQTSAGMVDNAQYDELKNELAAIQSYVQNPATPNAPTSATPTAVQQIMPAGKGSGYSDNFWVGTSQQGETFGQATNRLTSGQAQSPSWFSTYRNNPDILKNIAAQENYSGPLENTPLPAGTSISL